MVTKFKNIVPKKLLRQPLTREEVRKVVYELFPFGFVKGRIGEWRVRWQNKKPVIYKKADIYNASQTIASVNNRSNMAAAFRLAAALNKGSIREIWTAVNAEGRNSYTRLIKHFRKTLKGNLPSINNSVTPAGHHFITNDLVSFDSTTIKINESLNPNETLVIVLVPYEPIKSGLNEFEVIKLCDGIPADSEFKLNTEQLDTCRNYNKFILYTVLIKRSNNEITWSNTAATEGKLSSEKEVLGDNFFIILFPVSEVRSRRTEVRGPMTEVRSRMTEVGKTKDHAPPGKAAA